MKKLVLAAIAVLGIALGGVGIVAPAHALVNNSGTTGSAPGGSGDGPAG